MPPSSPGATAKKPRKKRKIKRGPESRDRHWLYQESVQSPEEHVEFFDRVYRLKNDAVPTSLKEDFCGTAFLSAEWVRTRPDNTAVGVDLDEETLQWGRENNLEPLSDEERSRVTLLKEDVMHVLEPKVDIVAALNFSYFCFKSRGELAAYFDVVRRSLRPGGLLVLDLFGGWESQMLETDRTRNEGFTYVWEQKKYDPVSHETLYYIHFKFHDGGSIKKAFVYDWRQWTMPEVREVLEESGFSNVDVYWEQIDDDTGEGSGEFKLVKTAENCPGWISLIVASAD